MHQIGYVSNRQLSYADFDVGAGMSYKYQVKAVNGDHVSAPSNIAAITIPA
jgi:hypothetical protein